MKKLILYTSIFVLLAGCKSQEKLFFEQMITPPKANEKFGIYLIEPDYVIQNRIEVLFDENRANLIWNPFNLEEIINIQPFLENNEEEYFLSQINKKYEKKIAKVIPKDFEIIKRDSLKKELKNYDKILGVMYPIFNRNKDWALMYTIISTQKATTSGDLKIFKKNKNKWVKYHQVHLSL